jgi:TRAP-type C4-dicarboxylate transport system permease small subunit
MHILSRIETIQRKVERTACYIAAGLVFVMIFPTTVDVVLRYIFHQPLPEIFQLSEFMMVGVVYLSIAYVQSMRDHIKIEMATSRLPKKYQEGLDIFGHIVGLVIFGVITWQSAGLAWNAWVTQDYTMGIVHFPLWPAKSILPVGTGLLWVRLLIDMIKDILKLTGQELETAEAKGGAHDS